jgi:predicted Zn-dependent protease
MPTEVYRVFVDGRPDELVKGVDLIGTPLAMFSKIVAAGDEAAIFTGTCGAESGSVPVTAISPALFISQIEIQKRQKTESVPPILPMPVSQQLIYKLKNQEN